MNTSPISDAAFRELQDILGNGFVSRDDSVRVGYAWNGIGGSAGPKKISAVWPAAITLPSTTEEVQAIVRLCNREGMAYRAHSTGMMQFPYSEGAIAIDLRRMDKIHDIDERNQMAIIEPYVTVTKLQTEALKKGLTCHVVGAGPNHSPLASAAAFFGVGITGQTTGTNGRNLLAFEWVTPTGEILRCGSAGSGAGWFSGEGPGPGFRGMLRGMCGSAGGLGVFTRIGYKLHPWSGDATLGIRGNHPQLGMPVPPHFNLYQISWDDWESAAAAAFEFKSARVVNTLLRVPPDCLGYILLSTNDEYVERYQEGSLPPIARKENGAGWTVLTSGTSAAEKRYKDRVVRSIVERTGGRFVPMAEQDEETIMLLLANSCYVHRVFRQAYSGPSAFGVMDSFSLLPKVISTSEELLAKDKKPGGPLASTHPEGNWIWPTEGRHVWSECVPTYRSTDHRAQAAGWWFFIRAIDRLANRSIGLNAFLVGPTVDLYGFRYGRVNNWMRRIKQHYDPNDVSESMAYISSKKSKITGLWRYFSPVLLSRPVRPLVRKIVEFGVKASMKNQI